MSVEVVSFYGLAALALAGAVAMLAFVRDGVAAVLSLLVVFVSLSGIHALLGAHAVAALQLVVQAGASLVLVLFVLLLSGRRAQALGPRDPGMVVIKAAGAMAALAAGVALAGTVSATMPVAPASQVASGGVDALGLRLFTAYVVPIEALGMLLLAAAVASLGLSREEGAP